MATHPNSTKETAINLLSRGEITFTEAARLSGVSRQRIYQWCAAAGIEVEQINAARAGYLDRLWHGALRTARKWPGLRNGFWKSCETR
jgi:hypothetical protein